MEMRMGHTALMATIIALTAPAYHPLSSTTPYATTPFHFGITQVTQEVPTYASFLAVELPMEAALPTTFSSYTLAILLLELGLVTIVPGQTHLHRPTGSPSQVGTLGTTS